MANKKASAFTLITSILGTDEVVMTDDPAGSPDNARISVTNFFAAIPVDTKITHTGESTFTLESTNNRVNLVLDGGTGTDAQIRLQENSADQWFVGHDATDGALKIGEVLGFGSGLAMTITPSTEAIRFFGNVGIGAAPATASGSGSFLIVNDGTKAGVFVVDTDNGNEVGFYTTDGDIYFYSEEESGDWMVHVGGTGRTRIGGTTGTPASTLHVYENTTAVDATAGLTVEQDGTGDAVLQWLLTGGQRWTMGIDNSNGDKLTITNQADLSSNGIIVIDPSSGAARFNGNVGLGGDPEAVGGVSRVIHVKHGTSAGVFVEDTGAANAVGIWSNDGDMNFYSEEAGKSWASHDGGTDVLTFADSTDIAFDTTNGTKIGTAAGQKIGFFGVTPVVQQAHIVDADGTLADITTKFNTLLSYLEALGLLANA